MSKVGIAAENLRRYLDTMRGLDAVAEALEKAGNLEDAIVSNERTLAKVRAQVDQETAGLEDLQRQIADLKAEAKAEAKRIRDKADTEAARMVAAASEREAEAVRQAAAILADAKDQAADLMKEARAKVKAEEEREKLAHDAAIAAEARRAEAEKAARAVESGLQRLRQEAAQFASSA